MTSEATHRHDSDVRRRDDELQWHGEVPGCRRLGRAQSRQVNDMPDPGRTLIARLCEACFDQRATFMISDQCGEIVGVVAIVGSEEAPNRADSVVVETDVRKWDEEMCENLLAGQTTAPTSPSPNEAIASRRARRLPRKSKDERIMVGLSWSRSRREVRNNSRLYRIPLAERTLLGRVSTMSRLFRLTKHMHHSRRHDSRVHRSRSGSEWNGIRASRNRGEIDDKRLDGLRSSESYTVATGKTYLCKRLDELPRVVLELPVGVFSLTAVDRDLGARFISEG